MAVRSDIRFTWFGRLSPRGPVIDPCLAVDEFKDAHPFEIRHRALAREQLRNRRRINDPRGCEPAAEQPVADRSTKMIEQPRREPPGRAFDASVEHCRR